MGLAIPLVGTARRRARPSTMRRTACGWRGCAFAMAHDDFKGGTPAKMQHPTTTPHDRADRNGRRAANIDEIAAVDGIDAWDRPLDPTVSPGDPRKIDHPKYLTPRSGCWTPVAGKKIAVQGGGSDLPAAPGKDTDGRLRRRP
jgi:hypothetical protein